MMNRPETTHRNNLNDMDESNTEKVSAGTSTTSTNATGDQQQSHNIQPPPVHTIANNDAMINAFLARQIQLNNSLQTQNAILADEYQLQRQRQRDDHQRQYQQQSILAHQHQMAVTSADLFNPPAGSAITNNVQVYGGNSSFYHQQQHQESAVNMIQRNQELIDMLSERRGQYQGTFEGPGPLGSSTNASFADDPMSSLNASLMQNQQLALMGERGSYAASNPISFAEPMPSSEQQNLILFQQLLASYTSGNTNTPPQPHGWQLPSYSQGIMMNNLAPEDSHSHQRCDATIRSEARAGLDFVNSRAHLPSIHDHVNQRVEAKIRVEPRVELDIAKLKALPRKKPKDKPKRPLSAYNVFFKEERQRILLCLPSSKPRAKKRKGVPTAEEEKEEEEGLEEDESVIDSPEELDVTALSTASALRNKRKKNPHGKIGFESLAREIGKRWKGLDGERMEYYKKLADVDMKRYKDEMEIFTQKQREVTVQGMKSMCEENYTNNELVSEHSSTLPGVPPPAGGTL
jgi:hypothetical protein